uniref:LysM domain-containing protein n=1 Tax=Chryseobacterium endophyticum TaxID=1854762 RepID=A0AAU6WLI4_9FLAO
MKKNSPDLTHKRTIQDGDTLPLMTERIYGDSKYYLEVAKVNNLINFRQLVPGEELYFPPIEKIS